MPKRDVAYMQGQREQIAQAALECMIENGVPETSLRDVCKRAGVSIGALYIHFSTKEELVLAACALDIEEYEFRPIPDTWVGFETSLSKMFRYLRTPRQMRRLRLSLQMAGELAVSEGRPQSLLDNYRLRLTSLRAVLERLYQMGEIRLPLGLDATVDTLFNLVVGTNYVTATSGGSRPVETLDKLFAAMALVCGRVSQE